MKALTVRQPFASLIIDGWKTIENRTWKTEHKGPLAIHASASKPDPVVMALVKDHFYKWWFANHRSDAAEGPMYWMCRFGNLDTLPLGEVIGVVDLIDGTSRVGTNNPWALVDHYHWQLGVANPFEEPVPAKGRLGLWEWER